MPTARKNLKDSVAATRYHTDKILSFYNTPRIAAGYGEQHYITPCERLLFDKYIKPGMAILDVGIGGGRTSEYLAARASRYVGIDYAPEMIRICRDKCPHLEYFLNSATDLSRFSDRSFDAVVMSYNMLDDLVPSEARQRCLAECYRVLGNGGVLIFSSHNPRAILARPDWAKARARTVVRLTARHTIVSRLLLLFRHMRSLAIGLFAAIRTSAFKLHYVARAPFWRGEGYMLDCEKLLTHFWVPAKAIHELTGFGFKLAEVQGDDCPLKSSLLFTDWYYYVFTKQS